MEQRLEVVSPRFRADRGWRVLGEVQGRGVVTGPPPDLPMRHLDTPNLERSSDWNGWTTHRSPQPRAAGVWGAAKPVRAGVGRAVLSVKWSPRWGADRAIDQVDAVSAGSASWGLRGAYRWCGERRMARDASHGLERSSSSRPADPDKEVAGSPRRRRTSGASVHKHITARSAPGSRHRSSQTTGLRMAATLGAVPFLCPSTAQTLSGFASAREPESEAPTLSVAAISISQTCSAGIALCADRGRGGAGSCGFAVRRIQAADFPGV